MRSTNPVLSRPEAFQRAQGQYTQYNQYGSYGQQPYGQPYGAPTEAPRGYQPAQAQGVMTIEDVITKSGITMGALFLVAAATYFLLPVSSGLLGGVLLVSGIVGFVTVMVVSLRRTVSPAAVMAYSVVEGVFIGALSKMFATLYAGIVPAAIFGTFIAAGVTLAAYKYLRIRVTGQFRRIVTMGTLALAVMYLVNLVISFFGVHTGLVGIGAGAGVLSMLISGVAVLLAVANLIMDFDYIEQGVRNGAPASESWRAAFGLTVTMVWLYTELLRILSYFRSN